MPRAYPQEFKDDVVRIVRQGELTIAQVARDFGISETSVSNWVAKADVEDGRVAGVFAAARNVTETRRTQRELEATTHEVTLLSQMSDLLQSCQPSTRRCPSCGRACSSCSPVRAAGSWSSTLRTINSMKL